MPGGVRLDLPVQYKTQTVRMMISALRAVYGHKTGGVPDYPEEQFQNLNVIMEWPLTRQVWPAIVVKFHEGTIRNAGVGHVEIFEDQNGYMRKWNHRHFDGSIEFELIALSPYDLMVLSDSLVEILSFGRLEPILDLFYDEIYGDPGEPYSPLTALFQLSLNTDEIQSVGDMNVTQAPWQAEDSLVYTHSYQIQVVGGFYNTIPLSPPNPLEFVEDVDVEPYITVPVSDDVEYDGENEPLPFTDDPNAGYWTPPFIYEDDAVVIGKAVISAVEQYVH